MHRLTWDLRHEGISAPPSGGSRDAGPTAVPGPYGVRLTVGEWSRIQPLELLIDPRVAADGVTAEDLRAQLELSLEVQRLQAAALATLSAIETRLSEGNDPDRTEPLRALRASLATNEGIAYPQPMLIDQIRYLYGMITGADQPPGAEAYERYDELNAWLARVQSQLDALGP